MRFVILLISSAILLSGCASKQPVGAQGDQFGITTSKNLILTTEDSLVGKVALVNQGFRFVVLNFPVGHLPAPDQHLNLYRRGVKVGEVKVTSQQYDDNVVADISTGDAEVGDEARKQ